MMLLNSNQLKAQFGLDSLDALMDNGAPHWQLPEGKAVWEMEALVRWMDQNCRRGNWSSPVPVTASDLRELYEECGDRPAADLGKMFHENE
jgi:hypothetical protein